MQLILFLCIMGAVLLSSDASDVTTCGKRFLQHKQRSSSDHSTDEGDWPWNAAIYHLSDEGRTYKCAGTLLHNSIVLTAARCVFENSRQIIARRVQVQLGRYNLNESGSNVQELKVHEIIRHPSFNPLNLENDIAIIRLSTEATLNDYVQPVCLWQSNVTDISEVKNELGTVVGWGIKQSTTQQRSDELQQALIPVITRTICESSVGRADFFTEYLFETSYCAGAKDGTNLCNGDSGGSMIFKEKGVYSIRGIVSRGVPKDGQINVCDPHEYFIFTDVVHFIPWIKEVVPELNHTTPVNVSKTAVNVSAVCGFNEEFAVDTYRCEETCEEYGNPLCVGNATEGRCYCKEGFVRLKTVGICFAVDNLACRAKMPPTKETCDKRQNEELTLWLHDEPCANTCENYNVPCNVTPPAGMFYGPHCVCKEGFSRLPNGKCVDIDDIKCKELWNPVWNPYTPTPTTSTSIPITTASTTTTKTPATTMSIEPSCNEIIDITLYQDHSYNGAIKNVQIKQGDCYDLTDFINHASSIASTECVILYDGFRCTGPQIRLSEDEQCRSFVGACSIPFNDKTNSVRLCPRDECRTTTSTPAPSCDALIDVTLYENDNFSGTSKSMQMKHGECYDLTNFNDRLTSLDGNACVILYEHSGCTGQQLKIREGEPCRNFVGSCLNPFNDITTSVRLCPRDECRTTTSTPAPSCDALIDVTFYENDNFSGTSKSMQMKQGECYDLTNFNDRLTSLDGNACVILYEHCGCTGQQLKIREGEPCRNFVGSCLNPFNDITTSVRLCPRDECKS